MQKLQTNISKSNPKQYKKVYAKVKQDLTQLYKAGSTFKNQLIYSITSTELKRRKKLMIISISAGKGFDKNHTPIHDKNS